jgi:DNA-directed RNA polymerase subunit L
VELNIIEETKNKLIVNIEGEGHTVCNALRKELWNDKSVKIAGYKVEHPDVGIPQLVVETSAGKPSEAVIKAAQGLKKESEKFKKAFSKVVK